MELVGGRNRYTVGGEVAEGPRWWRGWLEWPGGDDQRMPCGEVTLEFDNGRTGVAMVESYSTGPEHSALVVGLGPPPFDVP